MSQVAPSPRGEEPARQLSYLKEEYQSFVKGLAVILDGFERWREGAGEEEVKRWELVQRQALNLMLQHGIRPTARPGQAVDLKYHQVIGAEPSSTVPVDSILRVIEMGYEMVLAGHEAVILRPARVVLASADDPSAPA